MILPVGYANIRYLFQVAGISDTLGFGMGTGDLGTFTATEIAIAARGAAVDSDLLGGGHLTTGWTWLGCTVTLMTGTGPVVGQDLLTIPGTNTATSPPPNCTVLVGKNTTSGGRTHRGRFNLPAGRIEDDQVNAGGFILEAAQTNLQTVVDAYHDELVAAGISPFLMHSHPDDGPSIITSFSVRGQLATQRRRMR